MILGEEPTSSLLCGFAFAFDRHFLLNVVQIHHKLKGSIKNSDPGMSVVSAQRPNSDLNSRVTMQITGCNFNADPILVFPWIHPFGCDAFSSLGRVFSRQATA